MTVSEKSAAAFYVSWRVYVFACDPNKQSLKQWENVNAISEQQEEKRTEAWGAMQGNDLLSWPFLFHKLQKWIKKYIIQPLGMSYANHIEEQLFRIRYWKKERGKREFIWLCVCLISLLKVCSQRGNPTVSFLCQHILPNCLRFWQHLRKSDPMSFLKVQEETSSSRNGTGGLWETHLMGRIGINRPLQGE